VQGGRPNARLLVQNCYFIFVRVRLSDEANRSRAWNAAFLSQYCVAAQIKGMLHATARIHFIKSRSRVLCVCAAARYHARLDSAAVLASISIGVAIDQHR
jgi:hypothetical protein